MKNIIDLRPIKKQKMLNRNTISVFFTLFFLISVLSPLTSILLGHKDEVSNVVDTGELESEEKEPVNNSKNKILNFYSAKISLNDSKSSVLAKYCLNNYTTPHINTLSPPPKF